MVAWDVVGERGWHLCIAGVGKWVWSWLYGGGRGEAGVDWWREVGKEGLGYGMQECVLFQGSNSGLGSVNAGMGSV